MGRVVVGRLGAAFADTSIRLGRDCSGGHHGRVRIRIEGYDPPGRWCGTGPDFPDGHHNIHVAVQGRRGQQDLFGLVGGDTEFPVWNLDCEVVSPGPPPDLRGAQIHGGPGKRFIYLAWGVVDTAGAFRMFRRAKLWLGRVPDDVMTQALVEGALTARVKLKDDIGWPVCATLDTDHLQWNAG
jgi:hypothetical protein